MRSNHSNSTSKAVLQQQQAHQQKLNAQRASGGNNSNNNSASSTPLKLPPIAANTAPIATNLNSTAAVNRYQQQAAAVRDSRPVLTLEIGTDDQNSVFSGLAQHLFANNATGNSEARWITSRVNINPVNVTDSRTPCCIQLSGINFYLGTKLVTERLVTEAELVCARARRNGGQLAVCRHMKKKDTIPDEEYTSYPSRIVVAFYPGTKTITLKANMAKTLCEYFGPAVAFNDITPETYIITPRRDQNNTTGLSDQRGLWLRAMRERPNTVWIAKMSHGAKGRGIRIVYNNESQQQPQQQHNRNGLSVSATGFLDDLDRSFDSNPWIVQMYIDKPMLYDGRKFDLRAWVLLTPRLDIFLFKEGVCRMCSEPYSQSSLDNLFAHISNHCIQQQSSQFGKQEAGNEISWDEMDQLLFRKLRRGINGLGAYSNLSGKSVASPTEAAAMSQALPRGEPMSFREDVLPQMRRIIGNCFTCIKPAIMSVYNAGAIDAWQLFGFDFVLDEKMKLYLLEVNGAPGVKQSWLQPCIEDLAETVVYDMLPAAKPSNYKRSRPNWFTKMFSMDQW